MNRYKPVGWRNESYRHLLAAKGVKTKLHGQVIARTNNGIPITVKDYSTPGRAYPVFQP